MKPKFIFLLFFLSSTAFSQDNQSVKLEWKINAGDTLRYQTMMDEVKINDTAAVVADTTFVFGGEMSKIFNQMSSMKSNLKYESKLFINKKNKNLVDVEIVIKGDSLNKYQDTLDKMVIETKKGLTKKGKKTKKKDTKKKKENTEHNEDFNMDSLISSMAAMNNNVVLRGRLKTNGEIISTFYTTSQSNIIAMLFELPGKEVQVGEKWKINTRIIQFDQNFVCDSVYNKNDVYIDAVTDKDGDKIAVIKYDIVEYADGGFLGLTNAFLGMSPANSLNIDEKKFMKVTFNATGYFSLHKGRWLSYEGETIAESNISFFSTGISKSKTIYKLE